MRPSALSLRTSSLKGGVSRPAAAARSAARPPGGSRVAARGATGHEPPSTAAASRGRPPARAAGEEPDLVLQRRANLDALTALGVDPYPRRFDTAATIEAIVAAERHRVTRMLDLDARVADLGHSLSQWIERESVR